MCQENVSPQYDFSDLFGGLIQNWNTIHNILIH